MRRKPHTYRWKSISSTYVAHTGARDVEWCGVQYSCDQSKDYNFFFRQNFYSVCECCDRIDCISRMPFYMRARDATNCSNFGAKTRQVLLSIGQLGATMMVTMNIRFEPIHSIDESDFRGFEAKNGQNIQMNELSHL